MANYATMRKDELIALAQEKGVEADATMTKTQIIEKIESAENVTRCSFSSSSAAVGQPRPAKSAFFCTLAARISPG